MSVYKEHKLDSTQYPKGAAKIEEMTKELQLSLSLKLEMIDGFSNSASRSESIEGTLASLEEAQRDLNRVIEETTEKNEEIKDYIASYIGYEELKEDFSSDYLMSVASGEKIDLDAFKADIDKEFEFIFSPCPELRADTVEDFKNFKESFNQEKTKRTNRPKV